MARITAINEVTFTGNKKQVFKENKNASGVISNAETISNYSAENMKANSQNISFLGKNEKFDPEKFIDEFADQEFHLGYAPNAVIDYENIPEESRLKGNFYDKLADEAIITLDKGKNLVMIPEPETSSDLFIDNLTENIRKGKYRALGINNENTKIFVINNLDEAVKNAVLEKVADFKYDMSHQALETLKIENKQITQDSIIEGYSNAVNQAVKLDPKVTLMRADMDDVFQSISDEANAHGIVFIKDPRKLEAGLERLKLTDANNYFNRFENLSFVTIAPVSKKDVEKLKLATNGAIKTAKDTLHVSLKDTPTMEMKSLSIKEAKEFLKKNPTVIEGVLSRFKEATNLQLPEKAIDTLVDTAAKELDMPLPLSAMVLLHDATAEKLIKIKDVYKNVTKPDIRMLVQAKDIISYAQNHKDLNKFTNESTKLVPIEGIKTRMTDIIGLKQAKSQVQDIMDYIKNPEAFVATGRDAPGGAIFAGPPGTGKTELMRAIAGECGVPFFQMNGSDFGTKYINSGANAIRQHYDEIEEYLLKTGQKVAIFAIDEAETLGRKRSGGESGAEDSKVTGAWIAKMDGFASKESPVKIITLAATNRKEIMDPALLDRPSRLGTNVEADILHKKQERYELLQLKSKRKPFANEAEKVKLLNNLAGMTDGLNGDQITKILDNATKLALKTDKKVITDTEITNGMLDTVLGAKSELDSTPEERITCCLHEAGHAEAAVALKSRTLVAVSNEPRGNALALVYSIPKNEMTYFESIVDEIALDLGGGEAEKLARKAHGGGVSADYRAITAQVEYAIKKGGLGLYTPPMSFFNKDGTEIIELSKRYEKEIAKDTKIFLESGMRTISNVLNFSKDFVLNRYLDENKVAILAGQEGKSYFGEEYISMRNKWLEESGQIKAVPVFEKGLAAIKDIAQTDKFWCTNAKVEEARNIMSDGIEAIIKLAQETKGKNAEQLNDSIEQIVKLANNGSEWLNKNGLKNAEEKLSKTITQIVTSAKGEKKSLFQALLDNSKVLRRIR